MGGGGARTSHRPLPTLWQPTAQRPHLQRRLRATACSRHCGTPARAARISRQACPSPPVGAPVSHVVDVERAPSERGGVGRSMKHRWRSWKLLPLRARSHWIGVSPSRIAWRWGVCSERPEKQVGQPGVGQGHQLTVTAGCPRGRQSRRLRPRSRCLATPYSEAACRRDRICPR